MRIILFLLLITVLNARENPFVPVVSNENNHLIKKEIFQEIHTKLPSDARILKSVSFSYQTLTGDILSKTIHINKPIDFHSPIYVTQTKTIYKPKKIKVAFLDFYFQKHKLFIETKDKLIRHFILVEPFRVIFDFKANRSFLTYSKKTDSFIKKIVLGNHSGFYRVVLYTDGVYKPIVKNRVGGYEIDFK